MPKLSDRVNTFTDSVIRRMTRISDEYGAIICLRDSRILIRRKQSWMHLQKQPTRDRTSTP